MLDEIMTETQQKKFSEELDIDFAYTLSEKQRFRVNVYNQQHGIGAVFRVIALQIPTLQSLKLPVVFQTFCDKSHGLILITGPTGSGKSSSLAALINEVNKTQTKHIITIEDPIEFIHASQKSLITQREVQRDALSFQTALRAALREDPDIICVAELRDLESIRLALTAAETGHLVLATLHTASAPKTLDRLIDVFPGNEKEMVRTMLSESLVAIVSQQLHKNPTGGRSAIFEILIATPAIRHLIRENKSTQIYSVMQTGQSMGMCTFEQYSRIFYSNSR
jgi:twitching motility protein PilT